MSFYGAFIKARVVVPLRELYKLSGGKKKWTECIVADVLEIIITLVDAADIKTSTGRKSLLEKVTELFVTKDVVEFYRRLDGCKMERSLSIDAYLRYITKFKAISKQFDKLGSDKRVLNKFIDGLYTESLRSAVMASLDEKDEEEDLKVGFREGLAQIKVLIKAHTIQKQLWQELGEKGGSGRKFKGTCDKCGARGHKAYQCKAESKETARGEKKQGKTSAPASYPRFFKGVFCRKCHQEGHYANQCKPEVVKVVSQVSCTETNPFERTAQLLNDKSVIVMEAPLLLDTGASVSVVNSNLVDKLECLINVNREECSHIVELGSGETKNVSSQIKLTLQVPGAGHTVSFEETFIIMEMAKEVSHDLLLSGKTIKRVGIPLDLFEKEEAISKESEAAPVGLGEISLKLGDLRCENERLASKINPLLDDYIRKVDPALPAKVTPFKIELTEKETVVAMKPRRVPYHWMGELKKTIHDLREKGYIFEGRSEFASPLRLVPKGEGIRIMTPKDSKNDTTNAMKTVLTTEAAPTMPRLEELTSESWIDFMAGHEHYISLGGHKKWPELVDVTVLDIIKDLSKVPDFKTPTNRKAARTAVDKIFGASTTIDLYDELRRINMKKELTINALLKYTKEFKGVRNRVPKLGEEKSIGDHFVEGLHTKRLKECLMAQMSDTTTLGTLIGIAIVELKKIIESERTHDALEKEKQSADTRGSQRSQGRIICRFCGKAGHVEANCWYKTGKRRFSGSQ
ncbi:hypothetical protein ADUPG1_009263, partial [Aduncisulcus paluster]